MLDKGMVGLLRERHEPFRRAIALLLEGCVYRQYFIGAARRILEIMHDWQSYSSMEATAPRRAEITKLLQRVESDCTGLLQSLPLLCDHLDTYMYVLAPPPLVRTGAVYDHYAKADISGYCEEPEFNHAGIVKRLQALRDFCKESRRAAREVECGGSNWLGVDRGGSASSVFKEYYGSAKWQLVRASASVFSEYQPITATEGGPFYEFCRAIYELASGQSDPDDDAGMKRYVQFAAPRLRRIGELNAESLKLRFPDPLRPFRSFPPDPAREKRIRELDAACDVLQSELARGPRKGNVSTTG